MQAVSHNRRVTLKSFFIDDGAFFLSDICRQERWLLAETKYVHVRFLILHIS